MGQRRIKRVRARRREDEEDMASDEKEESGGVVAGVTNLIIEMVGTEEEAVEQL